MKLRSGTGLLNTFSAVPISNLGAKGSSTFLDAGIVH
jgi:hypothetical protein